MSAYGDEAEGARLESAERSDQSEDEDEQRAVRPVAVDAVQVLPPAVVSPEVDGSGQGGVDVAVVNDGEMVVEGEFEGKRAEEETAAEEEDGEQVEGQPPEASPG